MAERPDDSEKTEEPTQKKLDDARKKGDVPKSQELSSWVVMLSATLLIAFMAQGMMSGLQSTLVKFVAEPDLIPTDAEHLRIVWRDLGRGVIAALFLPLLVLAVAAVGGNLIQHAPLISTENMKPKLSKISLIEGWKRLFSARSLMSFAKGIAKMVIVGGVAFAILWPERDHLAMLMTYDVASLLPVVRIFTLKMLGGVVAVLAVIAAIDLLFERVQWHKKQRMTVQELKDEFKQMEGDPTVKAKLRQVRIDRGRKRMMAKVPDASVVVMNPTHFAVALQYEPGMNAPLCVAKGLDAIALKIRDVAEANDVPVVRNPPLARTLHASVEIDEEVPPEHYKAVAEVIGYVMRLRGKVTRRTGGSA